MTTQFSVAVHILTFLQTQAGAPATSALLASSVNTNPSLIRRLLSQLSRAGLTTSQMGNGGGALLARPAETITLLDTYRAIDETQGVIPIHASPNPKCPIGRNIQAVLARRISAAERALEAELSRTTIAELAHDIGRSERKQA